VIKKERAQGKVEWKVDAEFWWPLGEGLPTRYTVKINLLDKVRLSISIIYDTLNRNIGFRRVELIQDRLEGQKGTSIYIRSTTRGFLLGEVIGSQSIHTVQARGTEAKFRKWIDLLVGPSLPSTSDTRV
jgi:hypothetical protein